ncbi:MAG: photosystem II cytochrome PsbV2 [Okeania sp. SIO2F4]|uniref:photosystem II cytochrome PsbV2 n=1 Tax=Okeania sp. SIO2F4 TaxID=2607790 RepID=UPI001429D814|nr:photosystem II cytochrome PsbV2 [Okeania sp. SIO2F4]MDJ0517373.1 photosystem II cytochrome PsbV2 [Trichodesmium sp. MO_231.B1]NES01974.1 photosystem II cytochrome PsbV2 [Okeania sp. SIO2F4]
MLNKSLLIRFILTILIIVQVIIFNTQSAQAAVDSYVERYLDAKQPVEIKLNEQGETKKFSAEDLSDGKQMFAKNCLNCHVGGANLVNPPISLSLKNLEGATPPRDNLDNLVAFFRNPMIYDGSDYTYFCRQVTENWMSQEVVEKMGAFILRAAQKAPVWGVEGIQQ